MDPRESGDPSEFEERDSGRFNPDPSPLSLFQALVTPAWESWDSLAISAFFALSWLGHVLLPSLLLQSWQHGVIAVALG